MSKGNKYLNNFAWRLMENWSGQLVSLAVTMILARLLDPSDNGTVAIVTVFISLCSLFIDSGFGTALVQKKDADDLDFSTVFYFNVAVCIMLYGVMYAAAPLIAKFYEIPILTSLVRVQSLILVLSGVRSIQGAYIAKHLLFKKSFISSIAGTVLSAGVGILMAYKGYGVWALVTQSLVSNTVSTVIQWIVVKWRPKKIFSFERLKSLFSYGSKLLVSSLMFRGYSDLRQLIIGKLYSSADLAYYNRASHLPTMINSGLSSSIGSILFPAISNVQNDIARIRGMLKRTLRLHSYVLVPVFVGMLACAEPLTVVLFSEKWLPSVPYLRIFCMTYVFDGMAMASQNAIKAVGRSDLTLKIECIKTPLYIIALIASAPFGMLVMAYSFVVSVFIACVICALPSKKLFNYSVGRQFLDMLPNLLLSAAMGICVWLISLLGLHPFVTLLIQVPAGILFYILGSVVFKLETFYYVWGIVKPYLNKLMGKVSRRRGK